MHTRDDISGESYQQSIQGTCLCTAAAANCVQFCSAHRSRSRTIACACFPLCCGATVLGSMLAQRSGWKKYAIVMTTPSRGLSWFALLKGGLCRPWEPMQKGVLGKGKVAGGPGQPFLWMQHIVDAACGACHMPHATCIISSILNSVVASGGVVGAGLSDDSKHHASLTMLSSVSMSSPLRSLCCASVGDRMSRRATRPQSR